MLQGPSCNQRRLTRLLIAGVAGLWLLAGFIPCTYSATACDPHQAGAGAKHEHDAVKAGLDQCTAGTTLDCMLPDPQPPVADQLAKLSAPVAVLLVRAPLAAVPSDTAAERRHALHQTQLPPPPPNLRNAVLLI